MPEIKYELVVYLNGAIELSSALQTLKYYYQTSKDVESDTVVKSNRKR